MSMDLFLACVRDGKESEFERRLVDEVMGRGAVNPEFPLEEVRYVDGGSEVHVHKNDGEGAKTVSFRRFGGETFFCRLFELANRTGSFLFWAGNGYGVAVTDRAMLVHLPPGVEDDSLGLPFIVKNGEELEAAIIYGIGPSGVGDD